MTGVLPCQVNTLRRSALRDSTRLSSTSLFCKGGRKREVRTGRFAVDHFEDHPLGRLNKRTYASGKFHLYLLLRRIDVSTLDTSPATRSCSLDLAIVIFSTFALSSWTILQIHCIHLLIYLTMLNLFNEIHSLSMCKFYLRWWGCQLPALSFWSSPSLIPISTILCKEYLYELLLFFTSSI